MRDELKLFRVYGEKGLETFDEYCYASNIQCAVDRVREWHSYDESGDDNSKYVVIEVSKVMKGWK